MQDKLPQTWHLPIYLIFCFYRAEETLLELLTSECRHPSSPALVCSTVSATLSE